MRDPDNNCVELFCNRGDESVQTIRTADMTTRPFDIAAAGAREH